MSWIRPGALRKIGVLGMNRRNVAYISRYNDRAHYPLVDNKLKTKLMAGKMGLQVPALLHTINTQHEIEGVAGVLENLNSFVIKPAQGSGGKGILVIRGRKPEGYVKSSGDLITVTTSSAISPTPSAACTRLAAAPTWPSSKPWSKPPRPSKP
jgi:hypothetical protein